MKKTIIGFLLCLAFCQTAIAQTDIPKQRVAIFTPLYLDSAFDSFMEYRYAKNVFPKFINPGLEFYEGAQLALDSLNKEKAPLEVFVYDTRSGTQTLQEQLQKAQDDSVGLIIAYLNSNEIRAFADAGLKANIPVINVNLPNDGGVSNNPYYIMLNPTLKTQCEGIYRYIQKYYSLNELVVFRKKGLLEDRIKMYFDDFGKSTLGVPLKLKYVELPDSFTTAQLRPYLDTINQTMCIAGSLDENFGKRLTLHLASLKKLKYQSIIMGMPTWDNIRDFSKPEYKGVDILFSTPFYNPRTDKVSLEIINYFNTVMYSRPSDMVMRGYETVWKFTKELLEHPDDFSSNLTSRKFNVFREFDIQPVLNRQNTLEYFENKKLYFLRWQEGVLKPAL